MKFNNLGYDPISFYGIADGVQINGSFAAFSFLTGFHPMGNCQIQLCSLEYSEDMQLQLEGKISSFKAHADAANIDLIEAVTNSLDETTTDFIENLEQDSEEIEQQTGFKPKKLELNFSGI